ncbi:MAG: LysM peptidoglycan-binding domain-containing protein [Marinilabiliales bacterium]|nr:LysM peptidoglycan-binding domain-containing protein [Marinilabiliales bacterium]
MSRKPILPFVALMIALMVPAAVSAQVPVEVSAEKTIIGGKIYYMHEVLKNQTLYSISKAYKVSIAEIERENVIPVSGIQTGQVLRIPSREGQAATPAQTQTQTQSRPGAQPAQRPSASGSTAPAASSGYDAATGIKLARERIMYNGKAYFMHEVLKGQTLYSIARALQGDNT